MWSIGAGALVTLAGAGLLVSQPALVVDLDHKVYDGLGRWAGRGSPSGQVVLVDLDEGSLAQFGRWPWPRDLIGLLVRKIVEAGASTVALDMMFPEPDAAPRGTQSNDEVLAGSFAGGRVIAGYYFRLDGDKGDGSGCLLHPLPLVIARGDEPGGEGLFRASSVICGPSTITQAAAGTGFLNAAPDRDGTLRRLPLLVEYNGRVYPGLALAAVLAHSRPTPLVLTVDARGALNLRINDLHVPLDRRSGLLLRFRGSGRTFPHISAADILTNSVPAERLRGKVVLVGGSALGLQDEVATAADPLFPGAEVQATAIDNLLTGDFLDPPGSSPALELALVLATGFLMTLLLGRVTPVWGAAITLALAAGVWVAPALAFSAAGVFVSPIMPSGVLVLSYAVLTLMAFATEKRRAEQSDRQLASTRRFMFSALESLSATRDSETGYHQIRIQQFVKTLAEALASRPRFREFLTPETIELLVQLAPIHDIGKVGVPDRILQKPGPLTPEEIHAMKRHVEHGRDVLEKARATAGIEDASLYQLASEIVYSHHERWDGAGYPEGLRGEEIPISSRLLAVADVYDALVNKRAYKESMSHSDAVQVIVAGRGTQFDPDVVEAFLQVREAWARIGREFLENESSAAASGR